MRQACFQKNTKLHEDNYMRVPSDPKKSNFTRIGKLTFLIIAGLLQITVFAQSGNQRIKISDDIELIKISDNAYIHLSYSNLPDYGRVGANGLLFTDKNKAFLFDSPWTDEQTEKLSDWLKGSMSINIVGFVPNHWHVDCMGGLGFLNKENVESYANQMTIDLAKTNGLPIPKHRFKDSLELHLGDKLIKCYYLGAAHSLDNIVVWIPSEQILFAGCMVKSIGSRNLGNTADGDLNAYPKTLAKLLELFPTVRTVIPGHGEYGGKELIEHTIKLATK